jgi:hypothetical protein
MLEEQGIAAECGVEDADPESTFQKTKSTVMPITGVASTMMKPAA